jgi:hypothetical protein
VTSDVRSRAGLALLVDLSAFDSSAVTHEELRGIADAVAGRD